MSAGDDGDAGPTNEAEAVADRRRTQADDADGRAERDAKARAMASGDRTGGPAAGADGGPTQSGEARRAEAERRAAEGRGA